MTKYFALIAIAAAAIAVIAGVGSPAEAGYWGGFGCSWDGRCF